MRRVFWRTGLVAILAWCVCTLSATGDDIQIRSNALAAAASTAKPALATDMATGRDGALQLQFRPLALPGSAPSDMLQPEGRTLWKLTDLDLGAPFSLRLEETQGHVLSFSSSATPATGATPPSTGGAGAGGVVTLDPTGGDGAARWLRPDRFPAALLPGTHQSLDLIQKRGDAESRLQIELTTVGIGWVHLPDGPQEVALQRALIHTEPVAGGGTSRLVHQWVNPRLGIVASIGGPAAADGMTRLAVTEASVLDGGGGANMTPMRLYPDQILTGPLSRVNNGWDLGKLCTAGASLGQPCENDTDCDNNEMCARLVSSLVDPNDPAPPTTMGDLIGRSFWDFSHNAFGNETISTITTVNANETCNFGFCGYGAGGLLSREDKFLFDRTTHPFYDPNSAAFGDPNSLILDPNDVFKIHTVTEDEVVMDANGPVNTTTWLRAGTINEGKAASSLLARDGESRICYLTEGGETRSPVPLWQFPNQDGSDWYLASDDLADPNTGHHWSSAEFQCEQNIFNRNCGVGPAIGPADLYINACDGRSGRQFNDIIKEGVIKLPSGHTFNTILFRTVADFCVWSNDSCSGFLAKLDEARTVNYLWQVPYIGTVTRMQSPQKSQDGCTGPGDPDLCFEELEETDIKFNLLPPVSIQVTGTTDTTLSFSWDPGNYTYRIDDFRLYWDTDSGGATPYAFDSVSNPGQVVFGGTKQAPTATISGLSAGTTYHATVTSRFTYTNPSCQLAPGCTDTITYESLLFPTTVSGTSVVYPAEVMATTTGGSCIPTQEATGLTVNRTGGGPDGVEICWDASTDPCLAGYQVLGSDTPDADTGFSVLANPDSGTTCWTGTPTQGYFLVIVRGTGGDGPWGHYGM